MDYDARVPQIHDIRSVRSLLRRGHATKRASKEKILLIILWTLSNNAKLSQEVGTDSISPEDDLPRLSEIE